MSKLPIHRAAAVKVKDKVSRGLDNLPEVEFLRPWGTYVVGVRIRPYGGLRQVLMSLNYVKMVEEKPKAPVKKTRKPAAKKAVE